MSHYAFATTHRVVFVTEAPSLKIARSEFNEALANGDLQHWALTPKMLATVTAWVITDVQAEEIVESFLQGREVLTDVLGDDFEGAAK